MSKSNIESIYPLSPMQHGMLFHCLYAPKSAVYFEQFNCTLHGTLDVEAFSRAWQKVVDRYSVLRTSFIWDRREKPLQIVQRRVKLPLAQHDWRGLEKSQQQEKLEQLIQADRAQGFDLSRAPLMRQALIRLRDDAYQFLWSRSQLLVDGWSNPLILRDVFAYYEAYRQGQALELTPPRPYQDYIRWLQRQDMTQAERYWRRVLEGFRAPTPLGMDRISALPVKVEPGYDEQRLTLSSATTAGLQALTRKHQLTLNTLAQAAWALLLSHYSGEEDVLFGGVVSGRPSELAGSETMVGLFINTLPVRVQVPAAMSVLPWLRKLQEAQVEARQYEYSPLVQVQGWSDVPRGMSLFESILVFENYPVSVAAEQGNGDADLHIGAAVSTERTNYPLTVMVGVGGALSLRILYERARFEAPAIRRMLEHVQNLLEGIAADPEQRLSRLPLLSRVERERLLIEFNQTRVVYPSERCVHELFEEQVGKTSSAVAVVFGDQRLTYAELNARANQLAHYLRRLGVRPGSLVGICVERSIEMLVGVLGVMKTGAAYVPLDPSYPKARLAFMLGDAKVFALLTQERLARDLPEHEARVVCLDTDWQTIERESGENLLAGLGADNAAYVIYTSGSTGQPKGVQIPHRAVVNFLYSMGREPGLSNEDVLLAVTTLSFDIAGLELYLPLMVGARLIIASHEETADGALLSKKIEQHAVTAMQATPATWQLLIEAKWQNDSRLKIICGGEALPRSLATQLRLRSDSVWNMYGPTETTIWSALSVVELGEAPVTIGRPIANTQIYLLDREMQPVASGVAGELYIGGAGLAHGYLNRPTLTAEKFVPDPFSTEAGARLYRTGDLARYLDDGQIEFLGRIDQQVKIRGYRIELGEIETALLRHPAVRSAVVMTREDVVGDKRLVAYLVLEGEPPPIGWRSFLKDTLPDYMIPQAYVLLESLPLTPNGKVDRRALPEPQRQGAGIAGADTVPGNAIEEMIAGIWCEVLRVDRVGSLDNFFEVGGHSLLAMQIVSRVREALQCEVPIRLLFETPNLREFAATIEASRLNDQGLQAPPLQRVSRETELPLSFAQQRLWFLDQMSPGNTSYNTHLSVRLKGPLNVEALERALNEMVRRHEILRTSFPTVDGEPRQFIASDAVLELPLVDLSRLPLDERETEARRRAHEAARHVFDLARGPLLRAGLLRLDEQDHVLLMTMHHIINDGWSNGILISEVALLYQAGRTGAAPTLPELPLQYADFAYWQRQWLQGEALIKQLDYWKQSLGDSFPVLNLPTDRPRPAVQTNRGAKQSIVLPEALSGQLKAFSRREGATVFMTLLAAFQTLLYRYTEQKEMLIGTPIANRMRVELEGLIGLFVNTLVVRADLSGDPSFRQLLGRVKEVVLGAYAHQDLPFEQLVQAVQPQRDLSRTPLFQVMFDLQHAPSPDLEAAELTLEPWKNVGETIAKFDLTLWITEEPRYLRAALEYNTDLFDRETIERMLGHFQHLLEAVTSDADQRISRLPLLTGAEQQQVLEEWNATRKAYPHDKCIHQLFEAQAAHTPDAVAVRFGAELLTYRELNERANQLANYLRELGVGPEMRVGICLERSLDMIIGLLGILKAGGTYVPLDPQYPIERLAFMLEDSNIIILLTDENLEQALPVSHAHVVCLDALQDETSNYSAENPPNLSYPDNLAYVMFTSGSTGKPKGIAVTHRNVVRLVKQNDYARFNPEETFLQFAPISFDASTFEIWGSLLNGARLVVFPREASLAELGQIVREQHVTVLWLTAGLFHQIVENGLDDFTQLRQLLAGGDALSAHHFRKAVQELDGCRLTNGYGPTEGTTFTCCYSADGTSTIPGNVPIGQPIANTQVYILDAYLQPTPAGVAGELYIGGDGLARGYLNQPGLTAERFIPHPFGAEVGARLYKTGDLARYLKDGQIEFLGRSDQQVKVRGFRIELGEIEVVLSGHQAVREAVVVVREDRAEDKRLTAYVVAQAGQTVEVGTLRSYVQEKLPEYMVPASFVLLDEVPMTPNGKVDRRALPAPERVRQESENNLPGPRDAVEVQLTHIWEEVLNVKPVGLHDNFFDLGGHSLLAVALMTRIETVFGVKLPLAGLFQGGTVESLGVMLRQQSGSMFESSLVPIQPSGSRRPLFCIHPGGGNIVGYMELARHLDQDQPVYGLQSRGLNGEAEPLTRIESMAAHYIEAIRAVQPEGPYLLAGQSSGGILAFEMARQLDKRGEKIALVALLDSSAARITDTNAPPETRVMDDAEMLLAVLEEPEPHLLEHLRRLDPDEQARYVLEVAQQKNALPPDFGLAQFRHLFNIFKINYQALRDYVPKFYPGRVTLFRASEELAKHSDRLTLGWERIAQDVETHIVPGNHFNMAYIPHVSVLAEQLGICLSKAQAESSSAAV